MIYPLTPSSKIIQYINLCNFCFVGTITSRTSLISCGYQCKRAVLQFLTNNSVAGGMWRSSVQHVCFSSSSPFCCARDTRKGKYNPSCVLLWNESVSSYGRARVVAGSGKKHTKVYDSGQCRGTIDTAVKCELRTFRPPSRFDFRLRPGTAFIASFLKALEKTVERVRSAR